tara:strand:+ start:4623 stop:5513 length:891 start_codon:yes stop_codon:yes gene_type:complete
MEMYVLGMYYCQGPDPKTKKPNFVVPVNACDAHCHVFGPVKTFKFAEERTYTPPDAPFQDLQLLQRALGLTRAVIVQATCHGTDNAVTLDAVKRSQGHYKGVIIADDSFSVEQFKRMDELGVCGVRFSFARHIGQEPDFDLVNRVVEKIAPLGWHVVIYMESDDIIENVKKLSTMSVPVVIDHMGRIRTENGIEHAAFQLLLDLLRNCENFWVKICGAERISSNGSPYYDAVPFAKACISAASDRVLWGTDWPHPNIRGLMPNDGDLINLLPLYAPNENIRNRILVDNPERLYRFV